MHHLRQLARQLRGLKSDNLSRPGLETPGGTVSMGQVEDALPAGGEASQGPGDPRTPGPCEQGHGEMT